MTKKTEPKQPQPFEDFAQAARKIFNLPKGDVRRVQAATPPPSRKKKKSK
jgi:hypothetical protein